MKDAKSVLKEARDAIKSKNYDTSLKLCKQLLKEKKDNYTALVFLGVSLQETGQSQQALSAFKDAIKVDPSNPLAWNGLVNSYERIDSKEAKSELVKAYVALLKIEPTEKKLLEYCRKLSLLYEYGETSDVASAMLWVIENGKCEEVINVWVALVDLLSKVRDLPPNLAAMFEEGLRKVLDNRKTVCTEYYADYLNLLYKQNKIDELLQNAKKMHSMFEIDANSLKWICKIFNETFIETGEMVETLEAMKSFAEALLKLESRSPTALLTTSIFLIEDNKLLEAMDLLKEVVVLCPGLLHAWILLTKLSIRLQLLSETTQALAKIEKLLKQGNKQNLQDGLTVIALEALSKSPESEDLKKVLEMAKTLTPELKTSCLPHLIRVNINLGNFTQAKLLLADIKNNQQLQIEHQILTAQLFHRQGKISEALEVLKDDVASAEWWIEIGTLHWDSGERDKSLIPFLKAAKLEPANYRCFLFLGNYYKEFSDPDKARRCYEKAFRINSQCSDAGIELSKIYRQLKNWDANIALLQSVTVGVINKKNCWAWMQLGLNYLDQEDYDKAVSNLRYVIRIDDDNMHCWESLADAYLAKGAYTSALKCYAKASELCKTALYPLLQMANIKQILAEYVEAKANYEEILLSNKYYVPALKGISETCLYQAKDCFKIQRLGTARDHAQFAADKLIVAIRQRSDLACLWKLLADCCFFVTKLPEKYCCLLLQASFVEDNDLDPKQNKVLEKDDLFSLAARCYCKSLNLTVDNTLIWHDLASCYLSHALNTEKTESARDLLGKAQAVAQYCTTENPTYWQHWNLLGNVALNQTPPNYRLAQHALIKAVIAENNSAVSWCNLGNLYLILGDFKLANEAFSQAQRSDPNYVNSWIGQAILAESFDHEDAMDLFRHSTQLGVHQQGALGYAHWVCKTLKKAPIDAVIYSIHNMHAVPVACDNLTWYTENNPDDPCAWNMLGILRERMGLKIGTIEAFRNALCLSDSEHRDAARTNTARLLAKFGKYPEATKMFDQVEAATFNSGSGKALALFKNQSYKESYEAYEQALHWLTEEESSQSDLLVALASMAYMFQGPEEAKTLLFQSIQLKDPSPWGFYATLALGLLHQDPNLAQLVYKELQSMKDRKDCIQHYATLSCYIYLLQGSPIKAIREVSKLVHRHPDQASLWLTLSTLLIRLEHKRSLAAARCAEIAMKLGQNNMDVTKVLCLVSLASFIAGDHKNSLLTAQKAVHCYPDVAEGWAVLAASSLAAKKIQLTCVKAILELVQGFGATEALTGWAQKTICSI